MNSEPKSTASDLIPLPDGVRLRNRKFGTKPTSAFVEALIGRDDECGSFANRPAFQISWEDQQQGLKILVRECECGHLYVDAFCSNSALRGKAAVSVGFVGKVEGRSIRKTIPLDVLENNGCSGSADFGLLTDAVRELGPQLAIVVILLV